MREQRGYSTQRFASECEISPSFVSRLENQSSHRVSESNFLTMCAVLGLDLSTGEHRVLMAYPREMALGAQS